jgi:uncharacterized protein (TIGR03437 family)
VSLAFFVQPVLGLTDPTGTVQFSDGLTDLGTFPITLGQAGTTRAFLAAGARAIHATYSGDGNYCAGAIDLGHLVDRFTPAVTVASSAAAIGFGVPITFTAQLGPAAAAGVAAPTGQVQFFDGATLLGAAALSRYQAAATVSNVPAGNRQITAVYSGDSNWYSVRSAPFPQTVNRASTSTALAAVSSPTQIAFFAAVAAAGVGTPAPSGSVQFVDVNTGAVLGAAPLLAAATANLVLSLSAAGGRIVAALYPGNDNYAPSTSNSVNIPAMINAAGADSASFAADELVSLFGVSLASASATANTVPLPTTLAGAGITVTDSSGVSRGAGLYLVSPGQINFVMPTGTTPGTAVVALTGVLPLRVTIGSVAPGLFAGQSVGGDAPYLLLYGTGIRGRTSNSAVTGSIGSVTLPADYSGPQNQFPGLDQVNIALPPSLQGAGKVSVSLIVDGRPSNTISVVLK